MSQYSSTPQPIRSPQQLDELILVIRREILFPHGAWHGLRAVNYEEYEEIIRKHQEFLPRSRMETDPRYKQIIPYLVFTHSGKLFVMERKSQATESRLSNKLSLGIGGHINKEDLSEPSIVHWARREFQEEVAYDGAYTVEPLGVLNDDSNDVGKVHAGCVYLLRGDSEQIAPKTEFKSGSLMTYDECRDAYTRFESWSQMVLDMISTIL